MKMEDVSLESVTEELEPVGVAFVFLATALSHPELDKATYKASLLKKLDHLPSKDVIKMMIEKMIPDQK